MRLPLQLRRGGLAAATLLLGLANAASAQTAAPGSQTLTLTLPTAGATSCEVTVDGQMYEDNGTFGGAQATFNIDLDPLAAAGTYAVSAVCGADSQSVQITVPESRQAMAGHGLLSIYTWHTGNPAAGNPAATASSALTSGTDTITGTTYPAAGEVPYMTAAQRRSAFDGWLRHQSPTILAATALASAAADLHGRGQCTDLAAAKRPDIVRAIVLGLYTRWIADNPDIGAGPVITNWDASDWATYAREAGVPVGVAPRPGALMVFHSDDLAQWPGHIAYVNGVSAGVVYVTQEHSPQLGVITQGTYPARSTVPIAGQNSAVSYIY